MTTINVHDDEALQSLAGRTAIITGGSSGIGYATARILSQHGCNVVVGDLRPPVEEPQSANGTKTIHYQNCNVTDWDSLAALFAYAKSTFGQIDIVHANAGVNDIGDPFFTPLVEGSDGRLEEPNTKTIDINIKGTLNTVALGMHHLQKNTNGGSIIITASMAGYFGTAGMPIYTASKHALVGLLRTLAEPAASKGIAISLVAPGMTETPLLGTLPGVGMDQETTKQEALEELWAQLRAAGIPSQTPEVVAKAVCYLASRGQSATGVGLFVQGSEVIDIEGELARARPDWLSAKMSFMLQGEKPVWK